jgi:hypothetical protein
MRTGVATRATKKGGFQGYRDRQSRSEHAHALAHHLKKSLLTREGGRRKGRERKTKEGRRRGGGRRRRRMEI